MCSSDAKLEPCGSSSIITVHPVPRRRVNNVNIKLVLCKTCGSLDTTTSEDLAVIMNIQTHTAASNNDNTASPRPTEGSHREKKKTF